MIRVNYFSFQTNSRFRVGPASRVSCEKGAPGINYPRISQLLFKDFWQNEAIGPLICIVELNGIVGRLRSILTEVGLHSRK